MLRSGRQFSRQVKVPVNTRLFEEGSVERDFCYVPHATLMGESFADSGGTP